MTSNASFATEMEGGPGLFSVAKSGLLAKKRRNWRRPWDPMRMASNYISGQKRSVPNTFPTTMWLGKPRASASVRLKLFLRIMLKASIFREYDIRGIADEELLDADVELLGRGLA